MNRRHCLYALTTAASYGWMPRAVVAAPTQLLDSTMSKAAKEIPLSGTPQPAQHPLYPQAVAVVIANNKASIALVQRHLKIGYSHAARLLKSMEQVGLIGSEYVHGYRQLLKPHINQR
jgi:DNA segregation ATPase FtsK/SpoIIIE-like protein